MGSRCTIVIESASEPLAAHAAADAFAEIARIEQSLSDYRPNSESMQLMHLPKDTWHPVSEHLYAVMELSQDIHKASGGAFDPTIGAVTHLWRKPVDPSRSQIDRALERTGLSKIQLDPDRSNLRFSTPGMILDFGGIGKGYAAQRALERIRSHGFEIATVDLGGDLALGAPPSGQPDGWRVEVVTGIRASRIEYLSRCAVATSGDLERYIEYQGQRYSHIIDPATGFGIPQRRAATVVASDGAVADALASAASVLGADNLSQLRAAYPNARIEVVEHPVTGQ